MAKSFVICVESQNNRGYNRAYEVCEVSDLKSLEVLRGMYPETSVRSEEEWIDVSMEEREWNWEDTDSNVSYWENGGLRRWWEEAEFCDGNLAEQFRFLRDRKIPLSYAGY